MRFTVWILAAMVIFAATRIEDKMCSTLLHSYPFITSIINIGVFLSFMIFFVWNFEDESIPPKRQQ